MARSSASVGLDMSAVEAASKRWEEQRKPLVKALTQHTSSTELIQYLDTLPWSFIARDHDFEYDPIDGLQLGIRKWSKRPFGHSSTTIVYHKCPRGLDLEDWKLLERQMLGLHRTEPGSEDNEQAILMAVFHELPFTWDTRYTAHAYGTATGTPFCLTARSRIRDLEQRMQAMYGLEADRAVKQGEACTWRKQVRTTIDGVTWSTAHGDGARRKTQVPRPTTSRVLPIQAPVMRGRAPKNGSKGPQTTRNLSIRDVAIDRELREEYAGARRNVDAGDDVGGLHTPIHQREVDNVSMGVLRIVGGYTAVDQADSSLSPSSVSSHFEVPGDSNYDYDEGRTQRRSSSPPWAMGHTLRPNKRPMAREGRSLKYQVVSADERARIARMLAYGSRGMGTEHDDGIAVVVETRRRDTPTLEQGLRETRQSEKVAAPCRQKSRKRKRRRMTPVANDDHEEGGHSSDTMSTIIVAPAPVRLALPTPEPEPVSGRQSELEAETEPDPDWDGLFDGCMPSDAEYESEHLMQMPNSPPATPDVGFDDDDTSEILGSPLQENQPLNPIVVEPTPAPFTGSDGGYSEEDAEQRTPTGNSTSTNTHTASTREQRCLLQLQPRNSYPLLLAGRAELDFSCLEKTICRAVQCLSTPSKAPLPLANLAKSVQNVIEAANHLGTLFEKPPFIRPREEHGAEGDGLQQEKKSKCGEGKKAWPAGKPYPGFGSQPCTGRSDVSNSSDGSNLGREDHRGKMMARRGNSPGGSDSEVEDSLSRMAQSRRFEQIEGSHWTEGDTR